MQVTDNASDEQFLLGWISVRLWGYGHLFPWSRKELLGKIRTIPHLKTLEAICRQTWPADGTKPKPKVVELRRKFPGVWVDDDFDAPADWRWAIEESY